MLALNEALHDGYDEALLLDVDGFVAEGSGENVFIVKNGKLYTPELTSALDGITRKTIITLASTLDIQVIEKRITRDEMYTPIRELDNRTIGEGNRGPITTKLQAMYFDSVYGRQTYNDEWLSYSSLIC